jgi:hypothetical protein
MYHKDLFKDWSPYHLDDVVGTLIAFEIVTCHMKLCSEKAVSPASKKKLLALGV